MRLPIERAGKRAAAAAAGLWQQCVIRWLLLPLLPPQTMFLGRVELLGGKQGEEPIADRRRLSAGYPHFMY